MRNYENGALTPRRIQELFDRGFEECRFNLTLLEIQILPDRYRIVASDPFGPLPIIEDKNLGTPSIDEMGIEQIVRTLSFTALARSHIVEVLPDSRFLPVITVGETVTVSCQSGQRIWKAQDKVPVYAYQFLRSKVLDRWDPVLPPRRPGPGLRLEPPWDSSESG